MNRRTIRLLLGALLLIALCVAPVLAVLNASGTQWTGVDSDGDHYIWWFRADGKVDTTSPSGHSEGKGTWKQQGEVLEWDMNNGYAHYSGIIDGTHLRGKATNIKDHKWTFELEQVTK